MAFGHAQPHQGDIDPTCRLACFRSGRVELDTEAIGLAAGMYIVRVQRPAAVITQKLLVH
jgi:hypothetical protein